MKKLKNMAIGAMIAVGMFFGAYFGKDKLEEEPDEEEEPSSEVLRMPSTAFTSVPTESIEEDFKTSQERVQEVTDAILKEKERVAKEKDEKEDAERHEKALEEAEERRKAKEAEAERVAEMKRQEERRIAQEKAEEEERKKKEESVKKKPRSKEVAKTEETAKETPSRGSKSDAVWQNFEATYYGMDCNGCSGITANGTNVRGSIYTPSGLRVIAVDPRVIPLGSIVEVNTPSGTFTAEAADTGGAIKGRIIDILVGSEAESRSYGRQQVKIRVLK